MRLAVDLITALGHRGETIATAESLTGGLVCAALTEVPGASAVVRGGMVAYMTTVKHDALGVDGEILARKGAVSAETAVAMAARTRALFGSTWGVSATGVAGPTAQEGRPVGTVFVAVAGAQVLAVVPLRLRGDRSRIREQSCAAAISLVHRLLE